MVAIELGGAEPTACEQNTGTQPTHFQVSYKSEWQRQTFAPVVSQVDFVTLPERVAQLRHEQGCCNGWNGRVNIDPTPMSGANNILFRLRFEDGLVWLLRLAGLAVEGTFTADDASALRSEVMVMRSLRKKTQVPVPAVIAFGTDFGNTMTGCPFMIIEHIEGRTLLEILQDFSMPEDEWREVFDCALKTIAGAMAHLKGYRFHYGGDINAESEDFSTWKVTAQKLADPRDLGSDDLDSGGPHQPKSYAVFGPTRSPAAYLLAVFNVFPADRFACESRNHAREQLLRIFVDELPEFETKLGQFGLTYPDPLPSNFIHGEDGSLRAIVDWQRPKSVPRLLGNEACLPFLMGDWNVFAAPSSPVPFADRANPVPGASVCSDAQSDVEAGTDSDASTSLSWEELQAAYSGRLRFGTAAHWRERYAKHIDAALGRKPGSGGCLIRGNGECITLSITRISPLVYTVRDGVSEVYARDACTELIIRTLLSPLGRDPLETTDSSSRSQTTPELGAEPDTFKDGLRLPHPLGHDKQSGGDASSPSLSDSSGFPSKLSCPPYSVSPPSTLSASSAATTSSGSWLSWYTRIINDLAAGNGATEQRAVLSTYFQNTLQNLSKEV